MPELTWEAIYELAQAMTSHEEPNPPELMDLLGPDARDLFRLCREAPTRKERLTAELQLLQRLDQLEELLPKGPYPS